MRLSVIIPVGENDNSWRSLIADLRHLSNEDEIIFVSNNKKLKALEKEALLPGLAVSVISSEEGRAKQLNAGARAARSDFLWFVHCDSRFSSAAVEALSRSLRASPEALHFFDLKFLADGPRMMRLTELGVWIRSRILRVPFGDQGLCLSREKFERLGGFDECSPYGEDHLFVWTAHQNGVELRAVGHSLYTSARKYESRGWASTTSKHLKLTVEQAIPELRRLLQKRSPL